MAVPGWSRSRSGAVPGCGADAPPGSAGSGGDAGYGASDESTSRSRGSEASAASLRGVDQLRATCAAGGRVRSGPTSVPFGARDGSWLLGPDDPNAGAAWADSRLCGGVTRRRAPSRGTRWSRPSRGPRQLGASHSSPPARASSRVTGQRDSSRSISRNPFSRAHASAVLPLRSLTERSAFSARR